MENGIRIVVGCVGGLLASVSKFLAMDVDKIDAFLAGAQSTDLSEIRVTLLVFTPILMVLGGVIAWASAEENRMKLLAIGVSAPAIIAPWTTGTAQPLVQPAEVVKEAYAIVGPANAQDGQTVARNKYVRGVRGLLGITRPENLRYWVIVGSETNAQKAKEHADALNRSDPSLKAFVGKRKPDNPYFPIIVGGQNAYLKLEDANKLRNKAITNKLISADAYLSDYKDRTPPAN